MKNMYSTIDDLIRQALRDEEPYSTYDNVKRILLDNGIPFYVVKNVGTGGEKVNAIEVFECGIRLDRKMEIVKQLLHGENCNIKASQEIITITA